MNISEKEFVQHLEKLTGALGHRAAGYRTSVFNRFPLLFIGLSTFGFVATLYGFEKVIDSIPFLADRPVLILAIGFVTLLFTGTLYKKLR